MKQPPVVIYRRNPRKNYCPRKIAQHQGGCYCWVHPCCKRLPEDGHADDCGGYMVLEDPE